MAHQTPTSHDHKTPTVPSHVFAHAHFFPSEDSFNALIKVINSSQSTLDVCVFSLTDDSLTNAIVDAHKRGVQVRLITDDQQSESRGSDVIRLSQEFGISYYMDNSPAHMHNKFCVADGQVLVNGSYNWTKGARFENRENIVITNHPELVQQFTIEFNRLWQEFQGNSTLQSGCGGDNGKTRGMGGED